MEIKGIPLASVIAVGVAVPIFAQMSEDRDGRTVGDRSLPTSVRTLTEGSGTEPSGFGPILTRSFPPPLAQLIRFRTIVLVLFQSSSASA